MSDVPSVPSAASEPVEPAPASSPKARRVKVVKNDAVLAADAARDMARAAVVEIAYRDTVGEHVRFEMNSERLGTHYFASLAKGYPDWQWAVSVARAPRAKVATVCETNLVPTASSILAPEWVPWADRLAPGDLSAGDVLPYKEDDPRLEGGFEATGNEDVDQVAIFELGLGRARVLSAEGRDEAAQRWYDGENGPSSDVARKAPAPCATCGYFLPMAGVLRQQFGVCANDWSPADGKVVALDFGCGAHSEADMEAPQAHDHQDAPVLDELDVDLEVSGGGKGARENTEHENTEHENTEHDEA
ncbi:hypothetical protein HX89_03330 [Dermacoccus nishinomiyaensis]|uniref:DUF3027 domain-containing protein n=1 Tax=Dermacoccus nishinomiyaensis TaxID=1274 RepID=A0A075JEL6_9MICO|nr:DUF3027 domain-containing protein [Dermacoccus nishinomiyaensis]AIF40145.1 hypothetical protein HX89_03330 [Dermacoccus nishinomiyaensis]